MRTRGVPYQKARKAEKIKQYNKLREDIYILLATKYKWGPDYVSRLNPHQQWVYARGEQEMTIENLQDYEVWARANNKPLPQHKVKK